MKTHKDIAKLLGDSHLFDFADELTVKRPPVKMPNGIELPALSFDRIGKWLNADEAITVLSKIGLQIGWLKRNERYGIYEDQFPNKMIDTDENTYLSSITREQITTALNYAIGWCLIFKSKELKESMEK